MAYKVLRPPGSRRAGTKGKDRHWMGLSTNRLTATIFEMGFLRRNYQTGERWDSQLTQQARGIQWGGGIVILPPEIIGNMGS